MQTMAQATGAKAPVKHPKGRYACPSCGNAVEVYVRLSEPPQCIKHSDGHVSMEVIK